MGASQAQQTLVAERRAQAIKLKIAGADMQTIAKQCGYKNTSALSQDLTRAFRRAKAVEGQEAEALITIEAARLDRAQAALWPKVLQGELAAIDTFIRLSARRCKLLGLDAAVELKVLTMDFLDAELIKLREEVALAESGDDEDEDDDA